MANPSIPIPPPDSDKHQIAKLYRMLVQEGTATLVGPSGEKQDLPKPVYDLLRQVLARMQEGKSVSLVPLTEELTTQKAAEILGVSRQYLVRLLEERRIPFHRAGTHRRVYLTDLMAYKRERDASRLAGIRAMAQEAVDAGEYDTFIAPEDSE